MIEYSVIFYNQVSYLNYIKYVPELYNIDDIYLW